MLEIQNSPNMDTTIPLDVLMNSTSCHTYDKPQTIFFDSTWVHILQFNLQKTQWNTNIILASKKKILHN